MLLLCICKFWSPHLKQCLWAFIKDLVQGLKQNNKIYQEDPFVTEFGISVACNMAQVTGRWEPVLRISITLMGMSIFTLMRIWTRTFSFLWIRAYTASGFLVWCRRLIRLPKMMRMWIRHTSWNTLTSKKPVLGIRIRMFLGLPDPDSFVGGLAPDPSLFS